MKIKIKPDEYRLWVIIHQIYDLITKWEEEGLTETPISSKQFLVLWIIEYLSKVSDKPIILTDLIPLLYRSPNSISSIIDRMEKNGLVEKARDLPDRRAIRLMITKKGETLFKKAVKIQREMIKKLFTDFSDEELEILLSSMRKLKKNVNAILNLTEVNTDPESSDPHKTANFLNILNN